jgi:nucleoside-diphosphate-sugar epimerase
MTGDVVKKVMVTGGAGYKGSVLVPKLLDEGYEVIVYDWMLFGDEGLPKGRQRLTAVQGDIRDIPALSRALHGVDTVIHLACISNDPSFELDEALSRSINFDCFEDGVKAAADAGVRRFIYASTSSVYGVSDAPEVTEEHPLVPVSLYNRYKGMTEPLLLKHQSPSFTTVIVRPATVCGYSEFHGGGTGRSGQAHRRAGVSGQGPHPHRDNAERRSPLVPRVVAEDRREARLAPQAQHRRRRARSLSGVQGW